MADTSTAYRQLDGPRVEFRGGNGSSPAYAGQSYYGLPALKPSHYAWPIAA